MVRMHTYAYGQSEGHRVERTCSYLDGHANEGDDHAPDAKALQRISHIRKALRSV